MSTRSFRILVYTACLLVAVSLAYAALRGVTLMPLLLVLGAGISVTIANAFKKNHIVGDGPTISASTDLVNRARRAKVLGIFVGAGGLVWCFVALQFINASTMQGLLLTLGVSVVASIFTVICFIYNGILMTLAMKNRT